jgi:hypothetical protein
VSTTRSDVGDEGGSVHVGADRSCDVCFDRVVLGLDERAGCWKTEYCLLVNLVIVGVENRLKVGNLVAERHAQSVGVSLEASPYRRSSVGGVNVEAEAFRTAFDAVLIDYGSVR